MEPNCNSVFLLGWKTPCPLWRKMLAGLWLVSHPLSSLSGDGSLTDFTPKSALPVQGCDYTLNSQNGPASLSPAGLAFGCIPAVGVGEVACSAASPLELLPRPRPSGWASCLLLAWPALGCLSRVLFDGYWRAPAPWPWGSWDRKSPTPWVPQEGTERFPRRGGVGWVLRGRCSCLAGEPGAFPSTGLFSCPHGSRRFIACRLPLSSTSPQRRVPCPNTSGPRSILGPGALGGRLILV